MADDIDRWRIAVEDVHGEILARDVVPQNVKITKILSGPSMIEFDIHPSEPSIQTPTGPIQFKPFGHWIHASKGDSIWASGIVKPSEVDPQSSILHLRAEGFSNYPKGIPWLQNWNPIAVDPFEIVDRIWDHLQSYPNGNLGVTVYPTVSGLQMLPGFSFNNEILSQDFFAIFIRSVDRNDCGDYINNLARDIPFEFIEESAWNTTHSGVEKKIRLGYPFVGVTQNALRFRIGENITETTPKQEVQIQWASDVIVNGYFPGKVYSSALSNTDPDRYRQVLDEEDLHINSNERAAVWNKRKLTKRQVPSYFESIIIDPYHPNAPFGTFDVGDKIMVEGVMPWVSSDYHLEHKIMMITWDEQKGMELRLMAEGAFNYDPIIFAG